MKSTSELQRLLNERIPPDVVLSKDDKPDEVVDGWVVKKRSKLDYVRGGWVTQELNRIFGFHRWSMFSEVTQLRETGEKSGSDKVKIMALAKVRLEVLVEGLTVVREDWGCGDGYGDYHAAAGEAVTDAMKRAASRLGVRTGGMLYLSNEDHRRWPVAAQDLRDAIMSAPDKETLESLVAALQSFKGTPAVGELRVQYKRALKRLEDQ